MGCTMDVNRYVESTMEMALALGTQELRGIECCSMACDNTPDAAFGLIYEGHGTPWIAVCELCQEDKKNASYWWNKALRGESLDDEEE